MVQPGKHPIQVGRGGIVVPTLGDGLKVQHFPLEGGLGQADCPAILVDVVIAQQGNDGVGGGIVTGNDHPVQHFPEGSAVLPVAGFKDLGVAAKIPRGNGKGLVKRKLPVHHVL